MTTWTAQPSGAAIERSIITGMIVSDRALRTIGLAYKPHYFTAPFAAEVARWCLAHQEKYDCAPGPDIQTLFEAHRRNGLPPDQAQMIAQMLESISREFEKADKFNEQLAIDTAIGYFRERALTLLHEDLGVHLERGNLQAAHAAVAEFMAPANNISTGFEPLKDLERLQAAFSERNQLFRLGGDLGKMLGVLERGNAVAVVGKYKSTKSFTSQYIGLQALLSGLDVAWFDYEMGGDRIMRRLAQGLCAMPLKPPESGRVLVPVWDCKLNQDNSCGRYDRACKIGLLVEKDGEKFKPEFQNAPWGYHPCHGCPDWKLETWFVERQVERLEWRTAWQKAQAVAGSVMGARLKVQTWPKFSAGVQDLKAVLQIWRHLEGFTPDLVIIDQPSGMKMSGKGDYRHQVDELWKELCALAQELHCLALLPSQAGGKEAQERKRLRDSDVAEHSGILGHVDGSVKIDQDADDEAAKRVQFSMGVERDDDSPSQYCMVLQCLALGQPVLDSKFV